MPVQSAERKMRVGILGSGLMGGKLGTIFGDNHFFCNNFGAMKGTRPAADTTTVVPSRRRGRSCSDRLPHSLRGV